MSVITLTTDFGLSDWFVGAMKGVILGINPAAQIVDITHQVPAGDIRAGGFALAACHQFFPQKTIHIAVIDPGVGSDRSAIAVQTKNHFFIGPDNGVLSPALEQNEIVAIHRLENRKFHSATVSRTFHGRDVFAPVAAHLSRGIAIRNLGSRATDRVHLRIPQAKTTRGRIEGEVLYIDRFGNAITNISKDQLDTFERGKVKVRVSVAVGKQTLPVDQFYEQVPAGHGLALIGSTNYLEIAVNGGNAARQFKLIPGSRIVLKEEKYPEV
jgi:S-adenosyl-L-methionine hydrolase (adenosine-forming)